MKPEWEFKELGTVSAINYGYTESASNEPVGPRFLRITDIQNDRVDWGSVPYCRIESTDLPKYRLASGDIVFARTGATTGKSFLVNSPPEAVFASYLIRLRLIDKKLLPEFVSLFFQTDGYWKSIKDGSSGSAQGGFNATKLGTLTIPIPPLPEQHRIVGILDDAFEGITTAKANAEKNLQNARALFESDLQSVFTQRGEGWVEKRLEQIGTTQTGSTPKTSERDNYGDFISFIKPADFHTDGSLNYENDGLTEKGLSEARKVTAGSVLMVCIGATIGKCGYCDRDITTNQQINVLTPFYGVFHKFVYYQMLTENFQRRVLLSSAQATLPIINKSKWSALTVALPPKLEEQKRIAAKFDALCEETQRLESIYQQKLTALEALKKSLLDKAFSGEL
jgi:type I restriction enzyme S subunit